MSAADVARPLEVKTVSVRPPLLLDEDGRFAALGNRQSFAFQHALANHPLFTLDELRRVAARMPKYEGFVAWQTGKIMVGDSWGKNIGERRSLDETIAGIAENDSLVILKHAEQDEAIGPVLRDVLAEIVNLSAPLMRDDVTIGESIIFINSPGRVTKYHLDLEANYLLQVSGSKTVHVFDQSDRSIVPHEEVEAQCCGNHDAAIFKPERQEAARTYTLDPGDGVHFPSTAPHWVLNGDSVSISININFELRSVHHRLRSIHRFNRRMRRYGLAPTPPGRSMVLDNVKASLENGLASARRALRPASPADSYPIWTPRMVGLQTALEGNVRQPLRARLKLGVMRGIGTLRALNTRNLRFRGAFKSYEQAFANVRRGVLAGYDHDGISALHEELKELVHVWDYPILYWLQRLAPEITHIVDAGGHTGVKYRAFSRHLDLKRLDWVVFDLPTMVKAGRARARAQDTTLSFVERIEDAPSADVLLASGLLQYLDEPFIDLVRRMRAPPRHMLLNKVATRDGPTVVTLENFGFAEVPYQIRPHDEIPNVLEALGYDIKDQWTIPSLAHQIPTHPEFGRSMSRGYFASLRE